MFFAFKKLLRLTKQRDTKDLIIILDGFYILPASSFNSPPLCLPPFLHPLYGSNKGKRTAIDLTRQQHIALLSVPHPAHSHTGRRREGGRKEKSAAYEKTNYKAFQFSASTSTPFFSCSLLHSSAKGIPRWPAISESSSGWSYGKLMNWKMNRYRWRKWLLDPRLPFPSTEGETQDAQQEIFTSSRPRLYFCTDVKGPAGRDVIVTPTLSL